MSVPVRAAVPTLDELRRHLADFDVTHVGVASADVLADTRSILHERKAAGLHGGMQFTYRNPDRSTDPSRSVEGARSIIVAARPYLTDTDPDPAGPPERPAGRVGRYAWVDHYAPLREGLRSAALMIRESGHRAVAFADDNSIVDRAVARRAGLGWFGKNANILLPGAGSFFVLGSIVTTADYEPASSLPEDGCGSCVRCIEGCPTGAIVAPGVIDGRRCLSWLLQQGGPIPVEFRAAVGDRMYGCDDCQDVCPISVRLGRRNTIPLPHDHQAWVDALAVLDADDQAIEDSYGRWYLAGRDIDIVRRNALVVVGNIAAPDDERCRSVLERFRREGSDILAEHAAWALARLDERAVADNEDAPVAT